MKAGGNSYNIDNSIIEIQMYLQHLKAGKPTTFESINCASLWKYISVEKLRKKFRRISSTSDTVCLKHKSASEKNGNEITLRSVRIIFSEMMDELSRINVGKYSIEISVSWRYFCEE